MRRLSVEKSARSSGVPAAVGAGSHVPRPSLTSWTSNPSPSTTPLPPILAPRGTGAVAVEGRCDEELGGSRRCRQCVDAAATGHPETGGHSDPLGGRTRRGATYCERALSEIVDLRRIGERGSQLREVQIHVLAHTLNLLCDPADSEIVSPSIVTTGFDLRPLGCTS